MAITTTVYIYSFTPKYRPVDPNLVEVAFTQSAEEPTYTRWDTYTDFYEYINSTAGFMSGDTDVGLRDLFTPDSKVLYKTSLSEVDFQLVLDAANTHFSP